MTDTQKGILTLIQSAVTGEALPLPPAFSLVEAQGLLRRHNITALAYEGAVLCGIPREAEPMPRLLSRCCVGLLRSEGQLKALEKLFSAFEEAGVDYMPLKGARLKALYPRPELRAMGDGDVLIRLEQYDRIRPILQAQGYAEKVESDHELIWQAPGLYLELHKRLIPSYNPDLCGYFQEPWDMARRERGCCWALSPEDEWLYIFTHMAKHYRDGGVGLRHMTDLLVFRQAHPALDEGHIRSALDRLELTEFYRHVCRLLDHWFGGAPGDQLLEMMTDFIFSSGSFGTADCHTVSMMLRRLENSRVGSGRALYVWHMLFPGRRALEDRYPWTQGKPWLLPVAWAVRPVERLLRNPQALGRKRRELRTLTQEAIDNRRRSLKLVGLDFRF